MPYTGETIFIPLGKEGLTYNKNPSLIPTAGLMQADTVCYTDDSLRKWGGRSKQAAIAATGVTAVGMHDWFPSENQQTLVTAGSNGTLYCATSPSDAVIDRNPTVVGTSATRAFFVTCGGQSGATGRTLACLTDAGPPRAYVGTATTATAFTKPAIEWATAYPVGGVVHNAGLWAWGQDSAPHGIFRSTIDDHLNFRTGIVDGDGVASASSAVYKECHPGVGLRVWCGHSHKGMLFLLKAPRGVFWLDDSDVNPIGWSCKQITDSVGCAPSPFASILVDDGILFLSSSAQFFLITASTQGGIVVTDLSTRMHIDQWLIRNLNTARLGRVRSGWDSYTKTAYFSLPGVGSTANNLTLAFDFRAFTRGESKVRFAYSTRDTWTSISTRRDPTTRMDELVANDTSGVLWRLGQPDRSVRAALPGANMPEALTGYSSTFQTAHSNLSEFARDSSLGPQNKNFDWLGIEYIPGTGGNITVTHYVDGDAQGSQTVDLSPDGPRLASYPSGTEFTIYSGTGSTAASTLAGTTTSGMDLRLRWVRLTGSGRRISFEIASEAEVGADANITGLYVGFRRAGHDVGRTTGAK